MSPLVFVGKLGHVDIDVACHGGGVSGQAGAIRLALSLALSAFEDADTQEKMRQGRAVYPLHSLSSQFACNRLEVLGG